MQSRKGRGLDDVVDDDEVESCEAVLERLAHMFCVVGKKMLLKIQRTWILLFGKNRDVTGL